ncbi:MAG: trehalose-6-phosphate synthase [Candidatus Omnitrophota bacterium]|jgi:trehalose 6-phosphate synthase
MKRLLLFILPILIIVAVVFTVSGIMQARFTEDRLMDDLRRKAKTVDESLEVSARYILINNDLKSANRLVEGFQKRERLQGCAIYDKDGNIFAITQKFAGWKDKEKPYLKDILDKRVSRGNLENFQEYSVYSYIIPVIDDENSVLGMVEVIYDTSYVFTTLAALWKKLSVSLIILLVLILLTMLLIQRQIFTLPVRRLTLWFTHFQRGEIEKLRPFEEKGEFGKLVSEVEQVALGLRVARKVVTEEANERIKEELWTENKLQDFIHAKLGENAFIVVSNREPYMHVIDEPNEKAKCVRPASGVVTAIDPILRACGGTWIAHGSANADKQFVNSKNKLGVPPEDNRYILKRVWLTKEEEEGYYYGFSNEGLWPLCHVTHTRPIFREADWQMYKKVNQKFAESVLEELPASKPFVFIQDYHFTLLPKMIKDKRPDATVALFWHIPWPNPEVFAICPYYQEILDGMLGCDLIGFHVQFNCNNFLDTANRLTECRVDTEKFSVVKQDKETFIRSFPISVGGYMSASLTPLEVSEITKIKEEFKLKDKIVCVSVERIDYTKGIVERVMAIDRFLEKYPQYKNKFVFIQLAAPSRTHIKRYHELISEIDELVEKTNWKYSDGDWKPIIYLKRHFSPEEIKPYYSLGDFCIVSSLHDGMNLVAKEYVVSKTDSSGALILSKFTGAARELTDAVLINPYSIEEFAEAIKFTIEMPKAEKIKRMENMRRVVSENNIYKWAGNIITELAALKKS